MDTHPGGYPNRGEQRYAQQGFPSHHTGQIQDKTIKSINRCNPRKFKPGQSTEQSMNKIKNPSWGGIFSSQERNCCDIVSLPAKHSNQSSTNLTQAAPKTEKPPFEHQTRSRRSQSNTFPANPYFLASLVSSLARLASTSVTCQYTTAVRPGPIDNDPIQQP